MPLGHNRRSLDDKHLVLCRQVWQSPGGSPWTPQSPARSLKGTPKPLKSPLGQEQAQSNSAWTGEGAARLRAAILNKVQPPPMLTLFAEASPEAMCCHGHHMYTGACSAMPGLSTAVTIGWCLC